MKLLALLLALALPLPGGAGSTRGLDNHNPGNIRGKNCKAWPGCIGTDPEGHLRFRRDVDGIRAIVINLKAYRDIHGIRTLNGIAARWLKDDHSRADIERYAKNLAGRCGVSRFSRLALHNPDTLEAVTKAIVWAENSQDPYENAYKTVFPKARVRK